MLFTNETNRRQTETTAETEPYITFLLFPLDLGSCFRMTEYESLYIGKQKKLKNIAKQADCLGVSEPGGGEGSGVLFVSLLSFPLFPFLFFSFSRPFYFFFSRFLFWVYHHEIMYSGELPLLSNKRTRPVAIFWILIGNWNSVSVVDKLQCGNESREFVYQI